MARNHFFRRRVEEPQWLLEDALYAHWYNNHKEAQRLLRKVAEMVCDDKLAKPYEEDYYDNKYHPTP